MDELKREMGDSNHAAYATLWSPRGDQVLLELLQRRYELGEITRERFEEVQHWMGVSIQKHDLKEARDGKNDQ